MIYEEIYFELYATNQKAQLFIAWDGSDVLIKHNDGRQDVIYMDCTVDLLTRLMQQYDLL